MQNIRQVQRTYYLIISLFWLAVALPSAIGVLILQSRGMTLAQIGVLLGAYSLTIVLLEVPTGGLADTIGRKQVAILAYACTALGVLAYLFAFSFVGFLLAFIFNGIGRALRVRRAGRLVCRRPADRRSRHRSAAAARVPASSRWPRLASARWSAVPCPCSSTNCLPKAQLCSRPSQQR